jgi:hypothetical protein
MPSLREDRFFCSIPFVTQEAFYKTAFLTLYEETEKHPVYNAVILALKNLQNKTVDCTDLIQEIKTVLNEHDVIRAYTSNVTVGSQTFYNYMNQQLCNDNRDTLRHLMPLIRRATRQINRHAPSCQCIAYRGMKLSKQQGAFFTIGTIFRFPGFTSTSKSQYQAKKFGNTLFEIHIYAGCLQVRDVSDISHFPSEQEYLFSPYSLFEVTGLSNGMIILNAIDNMSKVGMNTKKAPLKLKPVVPPTINPPVFKEKHADTNKKTDSTLCVLL